MCESSWNGHFMIPANFPHYHIDVLASNTKSFFFKPTGNCKKPSSETVVFMWFWLKLKVKIGAILGLLSTFFDSLVPNQGLWMTKISFLRIKVTGVYFRSYIMCVNGYIFGYTDITIVQSLKLVFRDFPWVLKKTFLCLMLKHQCDNMESWLES